MAVQQQSPKPLDRMLRHVARWLDRSPWWLWIAAGLFHLAFGLYALATAEGVGDFLYVAMLLLLVVPGSFVGAGRLRRDEPSFLAARSVVNGEDPVGLLDVGAPEDEYDPEIEHLLKWRAVVTPEQVVDVFVEWFGESGRMPADMAVRIAQGVEAARGARS